MGGAFSYMLKLIVRYTRGRAGKLSFFFPGRLYKDQHIHHCFTQALIHHEGDKVPSEELQLLGQHVYQDGRRPVRQNLVTLLGDHGLLLVGATPGRDLLEPVKAVPKSTGPSRREIVVADLEGVADALPEDGHGALLDIGKLPPLVRLDEARRLGREQAQRVQHILRLDGARDPVAAVHEVDARERPPRLLRGRMAADELPDQHGGVGVPFPRDVPVGELRRLDERS